MLQPCLKDQTLHIIQPRLFSGDTQFQLNESGIYELSINPNIESFIVSSNKALSRLDIFPAF